MNLTLDELRDVIVRPTLQQLNCHNCASENLLVALALRHQRHGDHEKYPGLYPIDAALHLRLWDHCLAFEPDLASRIRGLASQREFLNNPHPELMINLRYATAIAWAAFLVFPTQLKQRHKELSSAQV
ncbi:hypothetical protein CHH28_11770 [Bacterioplanes sanyensis]|uniref:Uncharacterized protein n=1 Tax=Bacterioplanes sanyensis TaxID=1249553 RepID=A0A222FM61_9GAMM|nr:hypothetical protein [Bacterioplanes sanyensis]ASP39313.1 hypothetical protein CHH28_11770 [Bacterioplanes sanyensis]